jgi:hypothetical protein
MRMRTILAFLACTLVFYTLSHTDQTVQGNGPDKHEGQHIKANTETPKTSDSGRACLLNFEPKEYFVAVILKSAFHRFPSNPEFFYFGKQVLVTGKVREHEGKPEIVLNDASQIAIVEESLNIESMHDVVSWKDASKFYGKHIKVVGTVVSTFNSGRACFLNLQ